MKKLSLLVSVLLGFIIATVQGGEPVAYKQAGPPPLVFWGTRFYGVIDMGRTSIKTAQEIVPLTEHNRNERKEVRDAYSNRTGEASETASTACCT